LFQSDRAATRILDADYTFLIKTLANHFGIPALPARNGGASREFVNMVAADGLVSKRGWCGNPSLEPSHTILKRRTSLSPPWGAI